MRRITPTTGKHATITRTLALAALVAASLYIFRIVNVNWQQAAHVVAVGKLQKQVRAVKLYRVAHKETLPNTLNELVPEYLSAEDLKFGPTKIWTGKVIVPENPFSIIKKETSFCVTCKYYGFNLHEIVMDSDKHFVDK